MHVRKNIVYLIIIISSISYINVFKNEFVWDDPKFVSWAGTKDFSDTYDFFKGDVPRGHEGVYRPLRSIFYVISYKLWKLNNKMKYVKVGLTLFFIFTIITYSALTFYRNKDWKDGLTLWSKTVKQSPKSALAHNNLGIEYKKQGKIELAIDTYQKALAIKQHYAYHNNLGIAYMKQGKVDLAIEELKKARDLNPNFLEARDHAYFNYNENS